MSEEPTLLLKCVGEMDCPKEVVMWNYYDHEHLIGTHYKLYKKARILAENGSWALVYRNLRMPLLPFYCSGIAVQLMEGNVMKTFHKDSIGFLLEMEAHFEDLPNEKCRVTVTYRINTHPIFKIFQPLFQMLFKSWFEATWEEDAPMRLRRWKVHKLGFKDFSGIDYINKKLPRPENLTYKNYEFTPPVKSFSSINKNEGVERFYKGGDVVELGYSN